MLLGHFAIGIEADPLLIHVLVSGQLCKIALGIRCKIVAQCYPAINRCSKSRDADIWYQQCYDHCRYNLLSKFYRTWCIICICLSKIIFIQTFGKLDHDGKDRQDADYIYHRRHVGQQIDIPGTAYPAKQLFHRLPCRELMYTRDQKGVYFVYKEFDPQNK